jgi:hypothetical protein
MVAMYSGGYAKRLQEKFDQFKTYSSPKRKLKDGDWEGYDEFEYVQDDTKGKTDWRKVSGFALRYCVVFIYFCVVTTPLHLILFSWNFGKRVECKSSCCRAKDQGQLALNE